MPDLKREFPGLGFLVKGEQDSASEYLFELVRLTMMAFLCIYGLIAIAFRSYIQPAIVLSAVPFGLLGAIVGHLAFGVTMSMFSFMGVVAAARHPALDDRATVAAGIRAQDAELVLGTLAPAAYKSLAVCGIDLKLEPVAPALGTVVHGIDLDRDLEKRHQIFQWRAIDRQRLRGSFQTSAGRPILGNAPRSGWPDQGSGRRR